MWGDIENKNIKTIEESYCLGEACLIFKYDKAERTIAFKTKQELKLAKAIFEAGTKEYSIDQNGSELNVFIKDKNIVIKPVNETHATRLRSILENFKK